MTLKTPTELGFTQQETLDADPGEVFPVPAFSDDVSTATTRHSPGSPPAMPHSIREDQRIFVAGERLQGVYEVQDVLGTGGMGQVFGAIDHQLDREVAIKACWPRVDPQVLHSEAKALAALRHPGVVSVYAIGTHQQVDFIVMERLRGLTLYDHMVQRGQKAPFSVEEALDILIDISDALVVIHRAGLIHRDLKPANIMLAPGNRTVLLDLGISLRSERAEKEAQMAGSPHYMAPETIKSTMTRGKGHLIDIYALGIIAFEMLAGRRPFEHHDVTRLLDMQLYTEPPQLAEMAPRVPLHMCRLIGEMIRKDPAERPQSVEVVSAWLRGIRRSQRGANSIAPMSVLIADDDEGMRALLGSFVEQAIPGVSIHMAADGDEALTCFRRVAPDALILDLDMPRMTGVELCMYLRGTAQAAETTIVAVSGEASPADQALLEHLGVARFINKTSSSEEIFGPLVEILRSIHQTRLRVLAD
jgi:eukaryotic-like serine/threonine-protein kinase